MFSVIIPLYNKEEYIASTIQSVLKQSYGEFEVIVVNDGSTDDSLKKVLSFKDSRIHVFTIPNGGVASARNFGIKQARYDYLAFLDADDSWDPDYLLTMKKLIDYYPSAGLFISAYDAYLNGIKIYSNKIEGLSKYSLLHDYFESSYKFGLPINITSATCLKRKIANSIPMFRNGIKRGEDIDVWLRVSLSYPVAFCNVPLMRYEIASSNSLSAHYTNKNEEFPYFEWLSYKSNSKYYSKYVMLMIYIFAKNSYDALDYKTCFQTLWKTHFIAPRVKLFKRLYLWFASFVKLTLK